MTIRTNKKYTPAFVTLFSAILLLANTGCLKTRSQLKNDGDYRSNNETVNTPSTANDSSGGNQYVIDEIKGEITRLTGRIEDIERKQGGEAAADSAAQSETVKKLETRIRELEQAQAAMIEQLKKIEGNVAGAIDHAGKIDEGKRALQEKDYEMAIQHFSDYLKNPKGRYAEEAIYLRAEAFYGSKQYKRAITDFAQFPEKYTKSKHMPEALYKIGMSFLSLNNREDAKAFFQELIDKFPKSSQAKQARAKLK